MNRAYTCEINRFTVKADAYEDGHGSLGAVKNELRRLAERYSEEYLLNSYYFIL